MKINRRTGGIA